MIRRELGRCLLAGVCAVTVAAPPHWSAVASTLRHPAAHVAQSGTDAVVAQLIGAAWWLLAGWTLVALAAGLLARLPGVAGRCGRRVTVALVPRVLRGAVLGTLASGLVLTPALGAVATAGTAGGLAAGPVATAAGAPTPAWPSTPVTPGPTAQAPGPATPGPAAPGPAAPGQAAPGSAAPGSAAPGQAAPEPARAEVTVQPGDCLWSIAATQLRAARSTPPAATELGVAWPRWYAANRDVIGDDPGLIHPGVVLQVPVDLPGGSP